MNLAGRFNREIERLREGYLDLFADLSKKHDSLEWWCMDIASKNCFSIPLQLNITYLFCVKKIIENEVNHKNKKRLIFIVDSQALLDSISILGKQKNYTIFQYRKNNQKVVSILKLFFLYIYRIVLFLFKSFNSWRLVSSIFKPIKFNHPIKSKIIIIRSWITKGTLNNSGVLIDRNFGDLPNWLKSKGYKVLMLPMFVNFGGSIKERYSLIKVQNFDFILQESYLKLIDYIGVIKLGWKQINIPLKNITFGGIDLTPLFREIQLQQGFDNHLLTLDLCYPLLKRLKKRDFKFDKFYYPFENNVPEKPFILGCKKFFPDSQIIAYQHTVWYKNQLGMFISNEEIKYHPIADKIICSGLKYLEILRKAGFPENRLLAGPNLRFTSVNRNGSTLKKNINRPNILLPLAFDKDLAYELICKVNIILKDFPELFVYIRSHPLLNKKELKEFLYQINMTNYQYANNGSIQDWLASTDMVITTGGGVVILETVIMGVPLIRMPPHNNFFLDPFAWADYPIKPVNSPEEMKNAINLILGTKKDKNKFQTIGRDVLINYFTEINKNNMKVFS